MKHIAHLLEDFGRPARSAQDSPGISEEEVESLKLESFETGYKAGWDDAVEAQEKDRVRLTVDFARNLQDLSFTYHEAHSAVLGSIKHLVSDIVDKIVPALARETLGLRVVEQLEAMARSRATQRVELVVCPTNLEVTETLAAQDFGFPVVVIGDDRLSDGQVFLRFGEEETEIDVDGLVDGIRGAAEAYFMEQERKLKHG